MAENRPRLSLMECLSHAARTRSPRTAAIALIDETLRRVAPGWWKLGPWYAGRAVERLRLKIKVDKAVFEVSDRAQSTLLKGLLWLGAYETLERYAVARYLPRALPVVDLGAAIGVVSCLANRRLTDPAQQVSVEANPRVIPVLERNRDHNRCRFRVIHAALAYGNTSVEFGVSDRVVDSSIADESAAARVTVPAISLEAVLRDTGFPTCALLCDIEGAELDLVRHEGHVLRDRVEIVVLEVHPEHLGAQGMTELETGLARAGFAHLWRRGDVWVLSKQPRGHGGIDLGS